MAEIVLLPRETLENTFNKYKRPQITAYISLLSIIKEKLTIGA